MFRDDFWAIGDTSAWSRIQDKLFERALVMVPDETPDRWQIIADQVPGKTAFEAREHYEALVHDVSEIDSGRVKLPCYADDSFQTSWAGSAECPPSQLAFGSKQRLPAHADAERNKGVSWTEEEHRLFLIGLQKYGKSDWRSISRMAVVSRTPTQVASHAQKYYLRLNSLKKERKRSSIHDITTVNEDNSSSMSLLNSQTMAQNAMQTMVPVSSLPIQAASSLYQNPFWFTM